MSILVHAVTQQRVDEDRGRVADERRLLPAGRQQVTVDRLETSADRQRRVVAETTATTNELVQTGQQPAASYLARLTITPSGQSTCSIFYFIYHILFTKST